MRHRRPLTNSGREELRRLLHEHRSICRQPVQSPESRARHREINKQLERYGTRAEVEALAEAPTQEELMEKTGNDYSMAGAKIEPQTVTGHKDETFVYGTRLRHGVVNAPALEVGNIGDPLPILDGPGTSTVRASAIREAVTWLAQYHETYKPEHLPGHMADDLLGRKF